MLAERSERACSAQRSSEVPALYDVARLPGNAKACQPSVQRGADVDAGIGAAAPGCGTDWQAASSALQSSVHTTLRGMDRGSSEFRPEPIACKGLGVT